MDYSNHNTEPVSTNKESVSGGLHLSHHLNLSPVFLVFKTGLNLINRKMVKSSSYHLAGIKYSIMPNLYVCMYHKSHGAFYGDNIQWGIGFEF